MKTCFPRALSSRWVECAGRVLAGYRRERGLTLHEAAGRAGLSLGVVSRKEHADVASITLFQLLAILRAYDRTLADFERDLAFELDAAGVALRRAS